MLLCELIVRQTPQGFSLVRIHLKCNLFSPRNQSNTAIRDNYPSENLKTKFKFKAASKKKPDNKHSECTTLICNFHYYLSQNGKCYIHTYYAGTLKSISNLNVKGWRKIILKTYLQAVFFYYHLKWMQVLFLMKNITAYLSDILEHFNSAGIIFIFTRKTANSFHHFSPKKHCFYQFYDTNIKRVL